MKYHIQANVTYFEGDDGISSQRYAVSTDTGSGNLGQYARNKSVAVMTNSRQRGFIVSNYDVATERRN